MKSLRSIRQDLEARARRAVRDGIRDAYVWSCTKAIVIGPYGMRRVWDYYPDPAWVVHAGRLAGVAFAASAPFTVVLPKLGVLPEPPRLLSMVTVLAMNVWFGFVVVGPKRVPGSGRFEGDARPG